MQQMDDLSRWQQEVRAIYSKILEHQEPYDLVVDDVEITVCPNVFSPKYFTDSAWFAKTLPGIVGTGTLLEVGTGTGIVALLAALKGASVTANDLNPDAVSNAQLNFKKHGCSVSVILSDIYDSLGSEQKYDFIFWNHPFNRGSNPNEEMLLRAGFDYEYQSLERYISGAKALLHQNGRLLLGTGNFADLDEIGRIAESHGYYPQLLAKESFTIGPDSSIQNDYRIYEFQLT